MTRTLVVRPQLLVLTIPISKDLLTEEVFEAFTGIQPWCFEPPGRSGETQESEEDIEHTRRRCDRDSEDS